METEGLKGERRNKSAMNDAVQPRQRDNRGGPMRRSRMPMHAGVMRKQDEGEQRRQGKKRCGDRIGGTGLKLHVYRPLISRAQASVADRRRVSCEHSPLVDECLPMSGIMARAVDARRPDPRVRRTRLALGSAFTRLVLGRGYNSITAADIAREANVGRSTFMSTIATTFFRSLLFPC